MAFTMIHENYNVSNLDTSIAFYREALGLHEVRRKSAADGSFTIVYMADATETFELELTWLRDHPQKYDLGECEFHLAFVTDEYKAFHKRHQEMGIIEFENEEAGIYFIVDPDGYWIEIVPAKSA